MARGTIFELQTFRDGHWKVDSIFDDRALALSEAARVEESRRFPAVRVVQEHFDRYTNEYQNRVIYRSTKFTAENQAAAQRMARPSGPRRRRRAHADDLVEERSGSDAIMLILTLGAIVVSGIALILTIRYFADTI